VAGWRIRPSLGWKGKIGVYAPSLQKIFSLNADCFLSFFLWAAKVGQGRAGSRAREPAWQRPYGLTRRYACVEEGDIADH
jgi:hypothetical protein